MGLIRDYFPEAGEALIEVRHKFFKDDCIEIIGPDIDPFTVNVDYIINEEGEEVQEAPHPKELIRIPVSKRVEPYYLARRKSENK